MTSTASAGSPAMHEIHNRAHSSDLGFRQDAMAEVEDVAGSSCGALQNVADLSGSFRGGSEQRDGFQVALDGSRTDALPGGIQRNPPIDADDVTAGGREVLEKRRGTGAEVNHGHVCGLGECERFPAVWLHVRAIIIWRKTADPTVE